MLSNAALRNWGGLLTKAASRPRQSTECFAESNMSALQRLWEWQHFHFVERVGPRLMKNRQPYKLRKVMIAYNAMQVLLSGYTFYESWVAGWGGRYNWFCQPLGPEDYTPMDIRCANKDIPISIVFHRLEKELQATFLLTRISPRNHGLGCMVWHSLFTGWSCDICWVPQHIRTHRDVWILLGNVAL
ncbi:Elongation of very long chain fatty acids protein [Frankliniella fusca]|uniref:Elongation of very long chain fatty acids protein n=1 Tax=Frankliniella fusca TaxID=407009 RepID=A0AAE1I0F6_9NEOP|nr:Elongation of very long chain fatty acids protein [Frankliniella fusca]